jgi:hypothetical protein
VLFLPATVGALLDGQLLLVFALAALALSTFSEAAGLYGRSTPYLASNAHHLTPREFVFGVVYRGIFWRSFRYENHSS